MAVDPACPAKVLEAVMAHPTAKRLAYLANLTEQDLATDLSSLLALALWVERAQQDGAEWRPVGLGLR